MSVFNQMRVVTAEERQCQSCEALSQEIAECIGCNEYTCAACLDDGLCPTCKIERED